LTRLGLGEPIVAGEVPTDRFSVDRRPPHPIIDMLTCCAKKSA